MSDALSFERYAHTSFVRTADRRWPHRFSEFVHALGKLGSHADPTKMFEKYIHAFPDPIPINTGAVLFRLLFPHFTMRRRYQMKEKTLAAAIAKVMALSSAHADVLQRWDDDGKIGQGACLGDEVKRVVESRSLGRVSLDRALFPWLLTLHAGLNKRQSNHFGGNRSPPRRTGVSFLVFRPWPRYVTQWIR